MYYWILLLNILLYGVLTLASHGHSSAGGQGSGAAAGSRFSMFNPANPSQTFKAATQKPKPKPANFGNSRKRDGANFGNSRKRDGNPRRRVSRYPESVLNAGKVTPATRRWVATTLATPRASNHLSLEIFNQQRQTPRPYLRQRTDSQRWRTNIGRQAYTETQNPGPLAEEAMLLLGGTDRPIGVTRPYNPIYVPPQPETRQIMYETNSQSSVTTPKRKQSSRYRVLPNGSIVDYGTHPASTNRNSKSSPVKTTAPLPTDVRETASIAKSILKVFQAQSTLPQRPQSTHLQGSQSTHLERQPGISTAQMSVAKVPKAVPTTTIGIRRVPARQRMRMRQTDDRRVDDTAARGVVDDPRYRQRVVWSVNLDLGNAVPYASGRARVTTTTPKPTTTTKKPTTAKSTTSKSTTTTTEKATVWGYNGGDPVEIRYVNDTHVCPTSRARWQDYTVYLETKPRRCMIQIQWNARYKEEPIYHRSWWGVDVEWVYKTVYDPTVKFVDMHAAA